MAQVQAVGGDNNAGATTLAVTISPSTAGSLLVAIIGTYGKDVTGVADNLGQTWTQAYTPGTNTEHPAFWYVANTASGVTTVTATFSVSRQSDMAVLEESGIATSSPFDKSAQSTAVSSTTWDTTSTATTAQADEVAFSAVASADGSNRSFALDSTSTTAGWAAISGTNITSGRVAVNVNGKDLFIARRTLSATGTYNASGTCTSSARAAGIVTFKLAATTTDTAGDIDATTTVTGSGASTQDANLTSAGTATVTGSGASIQDANLTIASVATVTGSGASTQDGNLTIAATSTVTGDGASIQDAALMLAATSSITGDADSYQDADISISAVSTVEFVGETTEASYTDAEFDVSSSSSVEMEGASTQDAGGYCEVESSVLMVSESESITVGGKRPRKREDDSEEIQELLAAVMPQIWSHYV